MLQRLRQILLTQYIGAIVIAIVGAHCVQTFGTLAISIIWHWGIVLKTPAGVMGESQAPCFDWPAAAFRFLDVMVNGAAMWTLARWIYIGHQAGPLVEGAGPEASRPQSTVQNS